MSAPQFCPLCEVSVDLHDGPDSCEYAEAKARTLEMFERCLSALPRRAGGR